MKLLVIATTLAALAVPVAAHGSDSYLDYMTDAWSTIMDNNAAGEWTQSVSSQGIETSTIMHAGCVEDVSVCLLSKRIYPSGDTVEEYIPLNI